MGPGLTSTTRVLSVLKGIQEVVCRTAWSDLACLLEEVLLEQLLALTFMPAVAAGSSLTSLASCLAALRFLGSVSSSDLALRLVLSLVAFCLPLVCGCLFFRSRYSCLALLYSVRVDSHDVTLSLGTSSLVTGLCWHLTKTLMALSNLWRFAFLIATWSDVKYSWTMSCMSMSNTKETKLH